MPTVQEDHADVNGTNGPRCCLQNRWTMVMHSWIIKLNEEKATCPQSDQILALETHYSKSRGYILLQSPSWLSGDSPFHPHLHPTCQSPAPGQWRKLYEVLYDKDAFTGWRYYLLIPILPCVEDELQTKRQLQLSPEVSQWVINYEENILFYVINGNLPF